MHVDSFPPADKNRSPLTGSLSRQPEGVNATTLRTATSSLDTGRTGGEEEIEKELQPRKELQAA
jgi:hypothetical protein